MSRARDMAPDRIVFAECAHYLEHPPRTVRAGTAEIYLDPKAFSAFGRGGGNVALYERTHAALRERYEALQPEALLDIGTGEGLGLLPALTPAVGRVDVVEPSTTRIDVVRAGLAERRIPHRAFATTMSDFMARTDETDDRWELVQETFAMLSLPAHERADTLRWLRERTSRLILVEFDVPRAEHPLHPDWFRYVVTRYEAGMAEYPGAHNLVRQGFLAPVLLGTLRPAEDKVHFEQTIDDWCDDLAAAGFALDGEPRRVSDFWWGAAYLIEAK
ncbi:class I SAM-dependent methyltransferase [Saccharothrix sp. NPDC042600]|uniref:class I SAM-dependent methyltransferase n=1 Tax=Saccharothrix TaxID=2071 RepID=UPI0033C4E103